MSAAVMGPHFRLAPDAVNAARAGAVVRRLVRYGYFRVTVQPTLGTANAVLTPLLAGEAPEKAAADLAIFFPDMRWTFVAGTTPKPEAPKAGVPKSGAPA